MVLVQNLGCPHFKASLAPHGVRQLRNGGRFRFAREAARPGGFNPRGAL